jgi:hypothetical protein
MGPKKAGGGGKGASGGKDSGKDSGDKKEAKGGNAVNVRVSHFRQIVSYQKVIGYWR